MAKLGEQKLHTITLKNGDEKTFKFQHIGVRETLKLTSRANDDEKLVDELIKHVIFHEDDTPVKWSDFEEFDGGLDVVDTLAKEAIKFLRS